MKNTKRNTLLLFIILAIILYFLLKDDFPSIMDNLINANKWLILLSVIFIFLYWLFRAVSLYLIVKRYKKNIRFKVMMHQTLITQFFNGVTPFSTGGEPMQVYMLTKSGVKVANATNIILQEFIMYQIALVIIGLLAVFLNFKFNLCEVTPVLANLIILGFIINIAIGLFMIFVSFSKRFSSFVVKVILKIGIKFNFIKHPEKTTASLHEKLEEYNESGTMLKENKVLFLTCIMLNVVSLLLYYLIPFFVFLSLGFRLGIMQVFVSSAFILLIGNFVPIPGGSGGIEYAFLLFFETLLPPAPLKSALIIWRTITYYFGIVLGGISLGFFKGDEKK
jgi:uncharacterized protein (TIRG00374 family)